MVPFVFDCASWSKTREIPAQLETGSEGVFFSLNDLPEAQLPWDRVEKLAEAQGIGEADVVWDLAAGMGLARSRRKALPVARQAGGPPPVRRRSG